MLDKIKITRYNQDNKTNRKSNEGRFQEGGDSSETVVIHLSFQHSDKKISDRTPNFKERTVRTTEILSFQLF